MTRVFPGAGRVVACAARLVVFCIVLAPTPHRLAAQPLNDVVVAPPVAADTNGRHPFGILLRHAAFGVWLAHSVDTRTAAFNERFDGAVTIVAVRVSRGVPHRRRAIVQVNYVMDFLPLLRVSSEAPAVRLPHPPGSGDPTLDMSRYARRLSYGVGMAPLGVELVLGSGHTLSASLSATLGGELFTHIVPYGRATRANFAITPAAAVQWQLRSQFILAVGSKVHHVSNGGLGDLNPGMNAHLVSVSVMRR
jgi:hypothetical protein